MSSQFSRIFLLSHMRGYTSLLGHILGSHPQINGYYEMHLNYASEQDLEYQMREYTRQEILKPGSRYLFDKLLHNGYDLELERLGLQGEVILLSLRRPESVIKSIFSLFTKKGAGAPYSTPAEAAKYYIDRVQTLAVFSRRYPRHYYYFDAELIHSDTRRLLATLGEWLQLDSPLCEQYQKFSRTGVAGAGDTSPAIQSGKVIRDINRYSDIVLDSALLERAQQAYENSREQLIGNALAAVTG